MPRYNAENFSPPAVVARVTLHVDGIGEVNDVPFLIDTGADESLIPRKAVEQLGAPLDWSNPILLGSFDGSVSESPAVLLDLIFAMKCVHGRYPILDGDLGILGRDVLNHVTLVLDGPKLQWSVTGRIAP